MGQQCCVPVNNDALHGNASPLPHSIESVSKTNNILNRWRSVEVSTLQNIFIQHCPRTENGSRALDESGFFNMFPNLKELNLDSHSRQGIFRAFDTSRRGAIDFRDFCRGLSICAQGTRGEMLSFLFDMMVGTHTTVSYVPDEDSIKSGKGVQKSPSSHLHHNAKDSDSIFSTIEDDAAQQGDASLLPASSSAYSKAGMETLDALCGTAVGTAVAVFPDAASATDIDHMYVEEPVIQSTTLSRLLRLCGLPHPPPKFTYRSASGRYVEFTGGKLPFSEYMRFADAYIEDAALQRLLGVFSVLPGKFEERSSVINALEKSVGYMMKGGDTVYLVDELWWSQWCRFAAVEPVYDNSGYCVTSLKAVNTGMPTSSHEIPERPDGIDNTSILDELDIYSLREDIKSQYMAEFQYAAMRADDIPQPQQSAPLISGSAVEIKRPQSVDHASNDSSLEELHLAHCESTNGVPASRPEHPIMQRVHSNVSDSGMLTPRSYDRISVDGQFDNPGGVPMHGSDRRAFSIVPRAVWDVLRGYYGGGPAVPRIVCNVLTYRMESSDMRLTSEFLTNLSVSAWVDMSPLLLHMMWCDCLGNPVSTPRETVAYRTETTESLIARIFATFIRSNTEMLRFLKVDESEHTNHMESDEVLYKKYIELAYKDHINVLMDDADAEKSIYPFGVRDVVRVWTLVYHHILEISDSDNFESPDLKIGDKSSVRIGDGRPMIRHGPLSWWVLADYFGDDDSDYGMLVEQLPGICNGGKVMIEMRNSDGKWPSERLIEDSEFRLFEIGDKVDARDHGGNWYTAEIVDIEWGNRDSSGNLMSQHHRSNSNKRTNSTSSRSSNVILDRDDPTGAKTAAYLRLHRGYIQHVKVHFDRFSSKWDEVFPPDSSNLAPLGTHTTPAFAVPPLPVHVENAIRWLNVHGVIGKYDALSGALTESDVSCGNQVKEVVDGAHLIPVNNTPSRTGCFGCFGHMKAQKSASLTSTSTSIVSVETTPGGGPFATDQNSPSRAFTTPQKNANRGTIAVLPTSEYHDVRIDNKSPKKSAQGSPGLAGQGLTTPARNMARVMFSSMGLTPVRNPYNRSKAGLHEVEMRAGSEKGSPSKKPNGSRNVGQASGTIPGACGLLNIGNTCFMSTGLQCLSHTPLFRSYFLSGRYVEEINRDNPLGTGGRLVAEFAQLLRMIWSGNNVHISPVKFKRVLEKCKPIFSGHDQHDAQEFLSEMLDSIHEDVNRVVSKPYISAPEDSVWDKMTLEEQAADAWQRHLARNRSVMVDLFQGQIMSEVTCQVCHKVSRAFDPFMLLSVPLPKHSEKQLSICLVRKMPHFPRMPYSAYEADDAYTMTEFIDLIRERSTVMRYCVNVPKLGDVGDVKAALGKLSGIPSEKLIIVECIDGRMSKVFDDRDHISVLRDFKYSVSALASGHNAAYIEKGVYMTLAIESIKDMQFVSTLQGSSLMKRTGNKSLKRPSKTDSSRLHCVAKDAVPSCASREVGNSQDSKSSTCVRVHLDCVEKVEYSSLGGDPREGDLIVDLERSKSSIESFPKHLKDIPVGMRLDAIDHKGQWYPGQVLAAQMVPASVKSTKRLASTSGEDAIELQIRVHFDNFASKWDEVYNETDLFEERLLPLYTHSSRKLKVIDIVVINRTYPTELPSSRRKDNTAEMELFGLPMMFQVESFRSCEHVYRHIVEQSLRYLTNVELKKLKDEGLFDTSSAFGKDGTEGSWIRTDLLPFKIRIVTFHDATVMPNDEDSSTLENRPLDGTPFPRDPNRPIVNLFWSRMQIAVDWDRPPGGQSDTLPLRRGGVIVDTPEHTAAVDLMLNKLNSGVEESHLTLTDCLKAFTSDEELDDGSWYCNRCKKHQKGSMTQRLYQLPDILVIHIKRFNMTARFREKIRAKVIYPIKSLDMSPYCVRLDNADSSSSSDVYDLYGVSNHIGGMNGGHYTAFVRFASATDIDFDDIHLTQAGTTSPGTSSSPIFRSSPGKSSNTPGYAPKDKWLLFDDDFVEEIPPDKVVSATELAYVLFYKRRKLTPSNIINMTI